MPKQSKLSTLLEFDLYALNHGVKQMNERMNQLTFFDRNYERIIGVDEVGRGCLAGPVMASAVSYDLNLIEENMPPELLKLDDSKKISPGLRIKLSEFIRANSSFAIGHVCNQEVDRLNILNASMIAMEKAVNRLVTKLEKDGIRKDKILVLVDGKKPIPALTLSQIPITKGDDKSASIASASIVAKVTRDKLMMRYARNFPDYLWNQNKGYPSRPHKEALKKIGPSPLHRMSFSWA